MDFHFTQLNLLRIKVQYSTITPGWNKSYKKKITQWEPCWFKLIDQVAKTKLRIKKTHVVIYLAVSVLFRAQ